MHQEALTLADFIEGWELFSLPTLTGAAAGAMLGLLGVYVVLRRLVFLTAAISQMAGLGVALAFYLQIHFALSWFSPILGAALLTLLMILPVVFDTGASARRDSILGLGFLVGAAGTLAVGTRIVQELHDIQTLLFGTAVAVLPEDSRLVLGAMIIVLSFHAWWWRGFAASSFDPAGAKVRGLPVRLLDLLLFVSLALSISISTRVLGALPTFAFGVLPAMAAVMVTPNVLSALIAATLIGATMGGSGYVLAFLYQLPVGAAQTLFGVVAVVLCALVARLLRRS